MLQKLNSYLTGLLTAQPQQIGVMRLIPLVNGAAYGPHYITLSAALQKGTLEITEISQGGSVPNLKVRNDGEEPVLLLDGEELKGAKQNRVLNTSVLVSPKSELVVPVSCTEAGRWSYLSREFRDSGNLMPSEMRARKSERVKDNLKDSGRFDSDQGAVWDDIAHLQATFNMRSHTSAMEDVYTSQRKEMEVMKVVFLYQPNQCGIAVWFGGRFVGMDLLSSADAWHAVHHKVVASYCMDAVTYPAGYSDPHPDGGIEWLLERVNASTLSRRPSVGLGTDLRLEGAGIVGSSLLWEEAFVHTAVYPSGERMESRERYNSPRHRR